MAHGELEVAGQADQPAAANEAPRPIARLVSPGERRWRIGAAQRLVRASHGASPGRSPASAIGLGASFAPRADRLAQRPRASPCAMRATRDAARVAGAGERRPRLFNLVPGFRSTAARAALDLLGRDRDFVRATRWPRWAEIFGACSWRSESSRCSAARRAGRLADADRLLLGGAARASLGQ